MNLTGADLNRSSLSNTDLSSADLSGASLSHTTFTGVTLVTCYPLAAGGYQECPGANLSGAVIHRADLAGFNLSAVDLSGADLTGSDLNDATFGLTEPFGSLPTALTGDEPHPCEPQCAPTSTRRGPVEH